MQITSLNSKILISDEIDDSVRRFFGELKPSSVFILVDENTRQHCLPILQQCPEMRNAGVIEIASGEDNKTIENCNKVWNYLSQNGADRKSVLVNLGGGVICDLGGFAAATFKRGIYFVNIPTTLLSQVDASIGGKLAVNLGGLKNEIGVFHAPHFVLIASEFLKTIDTQNFLSGYAEMLKHALIYGEEHWQKLKEFSPTSTSINYTRLMSMITKSLFIKNDFVKKDPKEAGMRKALNFGHTTGHAFESWAMRKGLNVLHGEAVAQGIIASIYLSYKKMKFSEEKMIEIVQYINTHYKKLPIETTDYEEIYELMLHDKKNEHGVINFTLLGEVGQVEINKPCTKEEVFDALDFYRK